MSMNLSFLVPVYNVEHYLDECVQSILAACLPGDEIILVNDGSTDGSGSICDTLASQNPAGLVRVIHQANGGLSAARNRALQDCSKAFICFLDSDDVLCPETVEAVRQALVSTDPDILTCDALLWREGQDDELIQHSLPQGQLICGKDALLATFRDDFLSSCTRVYKRRFLQSLGTTLFPVGKAYEDNSIIPIVVEKAGSVSYLAKPLFRYRVRPGSITQSHKLSVCFDHARSLFMPLRHFQQQRLPALVQMEANMLALSHIVIAIRHAATIPGITTHDMFALVKAGLDTLTAPPASLIDAIHCTPHANRLRKHALGMLKRPRWYAMTRVLVGRWKQGRAHAN